MDVTLVLTHRCNLDCHYCYAGRHLHKDMDEDTLERGLDLLYADGANIAQLSFFGGEPFLARDQLVRAVLGARRRAEAADAELLVQCTTNGTLLHADDIDFILAMGIRVTVSIDGIREAHEMNRPRAGGRSSFDTAVRNLRELIARGADPDVCMVITPDTVPFVYRSVSWLWDEGVRTVRANLELGATWDAIDRHELEQELTVVGWDLLARRVRGEQVSFAPFMSGIRAAARVLENATMSAFDLLPGQASARAGSACIDRSAPRLQVVVGTTGNLYPCAPMVGEDQDDGPEARTRIGHLDDGLPALAARLRAARAGCGDGGECVCAAYLETGDRAQSGPMGLWFGRLGDKLGRAIGAGFYADRHRAASDDLGIDLRPRWKWRAVISGLAAATSGVALIASTMLSSGITGTDEDTCAFSRAPAPQFVMETVETRRVPHVTMAGGISRAPEELENIVDHRERPESWWTEPTIGLGFGDDHDQSFSGALLVQHRRAQEAREAQPDPCATRMDLSEDPACRISITPGDDTAE